MCACLIVFIASGIAKKQLQVYYRAFMFTKCILLYQGGMSLLFSRFSSYNFIYSFFNKQLIPPEIANQSRVLTKLPLEDPLPHIFSFIVFSRCNREDRLKSKCMASLMQYSPPVCSS